MLPTFTGACRGRLVRCGNRRRSSEFTDASDNLGEPYAAAMQWTVHGERTMYDSEWMRLTLVDVELPSGPRFEHHVAADAGRSGRCRRRRSAAGRAVAVAASVHHRHVGMGDPRRAGRSRRVGREAAARETLEESGWEPGPLTPLTRYFPTTAPPTPPSTSSSPPRRPTSARRATPTKPNGSSGSRGRPSAPRSRPVGCGDGLSLTGLLYRLAFSGSRPTSAPDRSGFRDTLRTEPIRRDIVRDARHFVTVTPVTSPPSPPYSPPPMCTLPESAPIESASRRCTVRP